MPVTAHAIISQMDLLGRLREFRETICADLWNNGLVVGVSGGPDSITLLHLLSRLSELPSQVIVAHLDHGLRNDSQKDGQFVANISQDWGFSVTIERHNVAQIASTNKLSIEDAGRQARYTFFKKLADTNNIKLILVGHNADDQVETILMHFVRGTGISGLSGMSTITSMAPSMLSISSHEKSDTVIGRPLLSTTRHQIQEYCFMNNLNTIQDPSNNDKKYLRNRIRHEVIPILKDINPNLNLTTNHMSTVLKHNQRVLQQVTSTAWGHIVTHIDDQKVMISRSKFGQVLVGIQLETLRSAIKHLRPDLRNIDFNPIANASKFAKVGNVRQECSLPGNLIMKIDYKYLVIIKAGLEIRHQKDSPVLFDGETISLQAPGSMALKACGWKILVDIPSNLNWKSIYNNKDRWTVYIDGDKLKDTNLQLRSRQTGDRFQPLGMNGKSQSLANYMTNSRIPYGLRDEMPLLVSGEPILCIPGWRLDQRVRVRNTTQTIWRIRMACPS